MTVVISPASVARAAMPAATPYPMTHPISGLTSAGQMIEANGKLFVSSGKSGSDVTVLSPSGARLKVISGEPGAWGMVASPDGDSVYVALFNSDAISVIDTSTLAETARYTVDACPSSLALTAGRLFYSFGCSDEAPTSGVSSIDPTSGGTPVATSVVDEQTAGVIRGSGTTLAVGNDYGTLTTYTAAADGSLTELADTQLENEPSDMAFTSDGDHLLVASGAPYQITSYAPDTLDQDMVYPGVAYPRAVAADPTGQNVAAGFDAYDTTVALYGETSGTTKWQRYTASTDPAKWRTNESDDGLLPQTLTFSADGSSVYGVVDRENTPGLFLFRSSIAPTKGDAVSISVPNVAPGKRQTATIKVHGGGHATVGVDATSAGGAASLGTFMTNSKGVAHVVFRAPYSGTVTAGVAGSSTQLPSEGTAKFTVGSKTKVRLVGAYRKFHGITYFKSYKKVNAIFQTTPPEATRPIVARLIVRDIHGHWRHGPKLKAAENSAGVRIFLTAAPRLAEMKVRLKVRGDSYSRGSTATTKLFEIA
jgi:YVTN family beta-propeller protein